MEFYVNEDGSFREAIDENGNKVKKSVALASADGKDLFNTDGILKGINGKPVKGYKKQRAIELWAEYAGKIDDRQGWIDLFVKKISGISRGVATVYAHNLDVGKWD